MARKVYNFDKYSSNVLIKQGDSYYEKGDFVKAEELYCEAYKSAWPRTRRQLFALYRQATIQRLQGKFEEAYINYLKIIKHSKIKEYSFKISCYAYLAECCMKMGEYKSMKDFQILLLDEIAMFGTDDSNNISGVKDQLINQESIFCETFMENSKIIDECVESLLRQANSLVLEGKIKLSIELCNIIATNEKCNSEIKEEVAQIKLMCYQAVPVQANKYLGEGRVEELIELCNIILLDPAQSVEIKMKVRQIQIDCYQNSANTKLQEGEIEEALKLCDKLFSENDLSNQTKIKLKEIQLECYYHRAIELSKDNLEESIKLWNMLLNEEDCIQEFKEKIKKSRIECYEVLIDQINNVLQSTNKFRNKEILQVYLGKCNLLLENLYIPNDEILIKNTLKVKSNINSILLHYLEKQWSMNNSKVKKIITVITRRAHNRQNNKEQRIETILNKARNLLECHKKRGDDFFEDFREIEVKKYPFSDMYDFYQNVCPWDSYELIDKALGLVQEAYRITEDLPSQRANVLEVWADCLRIKDDYKLFKDIVVIYENALQNQQYSSRRAEYAKRKIEHVTRKINLLEKTKIEDVLLAPKMCEVITSEPKHIKRINRFRSIIRSNGFLPKTNDGIMLSVTKTNVQLHDGNHRLLALALERPETKVVDILNNSKDQVHTKKCVIKPYHYMSSIKFRDPVQDARLNNICQPEKQHGNFVSQWIDSSEGRVQRVFSKPISFLDTKFLNCESFGKPVGEAKKILNAKDSYTEFM